MTPRRPWMAHPKRHDDIRHVLGLIVLLLLLTAASFRPDVVLP